MLHLSINKRLNLKMTKVGARWAIGAIDKHCSMTSIGYGLGVVVESKSQSLIDVEVLYARGRDVVLGRS
jgi:hypothetical protein